MHSRIMVSLSVTGTFIVEETKIEIRSKLSIKGLANQSNVGDLSLVLIYDYAC